MMYRSLNSLFSPPGNISGPDNDNHSNVEDQKELEEGEGLRILVVEDELFVRLDIQMALTAAGHQVVGSATSADAAVQLAGRHKPDLVIMDIRLDGTRDGVDAAIEIWQRFGIRSFFASANLDPMLRLRASAGNPLGFIEKPFTGSELVNAIKGRN